MMLASRTSSWLLTLLALGLSTAAVGCASVSKFPDKANPPAATTEDRAADVVRDFELKRDEAQYSAAGQSLRKGDLRASRTNLEQLLARNPKHRASRLLLAEVLVCEGQPQMAAMQLEVARTHFADDAEIEHTLALVRDSMDQHEVALAHFRRASQLEPENQLYAASLQTATASPLAPLVLDVAPQVATAPAGTTASAATPQVAQVAYEARVAAGPVVTPAPVGTPALLPSERGAPPARPALSAASSTGDESIRFAEVEHLPLGQAMAAMQRPSASTSLNLASADQLVQRGRQAIESGNIEAGMAFFRQAMSEEPQNQQIPISAGVALLRTGEPIPAVELMSEAAKSFPSSPRIHQTLGLAQFQSGDFQAAQSTLRHALSLDNSHALSYFLMGSALAKLGQREEAARHFEQARALDSRYDVRR